MLDLITEGSRFTPTLFNGPSMVYTSVSHVLTQEKAKLSCLCVPTTTGWTLLDTLQTLRDSIQEVSSVHVYTIYMYLPYLYLCEMLIFTLMTFARWL